MKKSILMPISYLFLVAGLATLIFFMLALFSVWHPNSDAEWISLLFVGLIVYFIGEYIQVSLVEPRSRFQRERQRSVKNMCITVIFLSVCMLICLVSNFI